MASLGAADIGAGEIVNNRRFYNPPDVSLVRTESDTYLSVSIGSGYRAHPLNTTTQDRFYSVRDYNPFEQLTQTTHDA